MRGRITAGLIGGGYVVAAMTGHDVLFVRPWFRWPVVVTGVALLLVACVSPPVLSVRAVVALLAPLAIGLTITPARVTGVAAGAVAGGPLVERRLGDDPNPLLGERAAAGTFVDATVLDVVLAEREVGAVALDGRSVSVVAAVSGATELTRMVMVCCAADARSVSLVMRGAPLPIGEWVAVTGELRADGDRVVLDAKTVRTVAAPQEPFL